MSIGLWAQVAVLLIYIYVILNCLGQVCIWAELLIQRRLCPIFVRDVRSPDLHKCFRGLMGSQRTLGFWGVTTLLS